MVVVACRQLALVLVVLGAPLASGQQATCRTDLDGNGIVGTPDLLHLLSAFGRAVAERPEVASVDFNSDGVVGTEDLLHLLATFGDICDTPGTVDVEAAAELFVEAMRNATADPFTPLVAVSSSISFSGDIAAITADLQARQEFEQGFAQSMASSLGDGSTVSPEMVVIDDIREMQAEWEGVGRRRLQSETEAPVLIEVLFHLLIPEALEVAGSSLITSLQDNDQQIEIAVAGLTFTADTASIAPPTVLPAVVDCEGAWVPSEDECSEPCGPDGVRTQTFVVFRAEQNGGNNCIDAETLPQPIPCNTHVQCPVNCVGEWGEWGECSLPCGSGTQNRNYVVLQEPQHGGASCPDQDTSQSQACNPEPCTPPPPQAVDCVGSWSDYGECSHTCGPDGLQQRSFAVTQVASNGGAACAQEGGDVESQSCNTEIQCAIDCEGQWPDFGPCSAVCGPGTRTREFQVTVPAENGGSCPEEGSTQTEDCDNLCPASLTERDVEPGPIALPVAGAFELATLIKLPEGASFARGSALPVARSYNGNDWEGTMPEPVDFDCSEEPPVTCSTTLPEGATYQLRMYDGTSLVSQDPKVVASRFLTQTTFGPQLDEIYGLSASTVEETEAAIEAWLYEQMEMEPSLHRVYLRQRTNNMAYNNPAAMVRPPCEEASSWVTFAFSKFDHGKLLDVSLSSDGSYSLSIEGVVRTVVQSTKDIREDIEWSCFKRGFRTPLDMPGTSPTIEASVEACHQRCVSTDGCGYFSLNEDNMECHLQTSSAGGLKGAGGPWRTGPADCSLATYTYPPGPEEAEAAGLRNMGNSCWGQCGSHGPCPGRCGTNGFCCRYGRDIGGCVTTDPTATSHRCIPDPSMPPPPPPPAPRLLANTTYTVCFVNEYEGGDVALLPPGVNFPGNDWKVSSCGRPGGSQIVIGNPPVNLLEPDMWITQQLDAVDMVPMPIPLRDSYSLRNIVEPCELPPNPTVFILHGEKYYRHEPRKQLVENTVDNPYIEERMIFQRDRQFIPSLTPKFCPAAQPSFTNAHGCVRQNSCARPQWTDGTVTLNHELMRGLFTKSHKYVYTITRPLEGFSNDEISACSVETRWKKTAGSCDVDTSLDDATLASLSAALQQVPVEGLGPQYTSGPNNANSVAACDAGSGTTGRVGTLEDMQAVCDADPNCGWLHDYGCDANNWRACGPVSDMAAGSAACTMLKGEGPGSAQTELVLETADIIVIGIVQGECTTELNGVSIVGAKVTLNGTCYEQVHPESHNVYDIAYWRGRLGEAGVSSRDTVTVPATQGLTELDLTSVCADLSCWPTRFSGRNPTPLVRYMGVLGEEVAFSSLPTTVQVPWLAEFAGVEDISADPGVTESCGSIGEVANDPAFGHKYGGRYVGAQKPTYWPKAMLWQNAVYHAEDQLRQRVAWALSQIYVVAEVGYGGSSETMSKFYDIFLRNAFGNFRNLIKEVAYSEPMAVMLTFLNSKSARISGDFADENFARECIQLFTLGTEHLNLDGTPVLDADGNRVATYGVKDVASFARVWTGFVSTGGDLRTNRIGGTDTLKINPTYRDASPKMDLYDGFIGDRYPACVDLPKRPFLRKGFSYAYRGDTVAHLDSLKDGAGVVSFSTLDDPSSPLFQALCNREGADCTFPSEVTLEQTLPCSGSECTWDRAPLVRVIDGSGTDAYYEGIEFDCVQFPFFENGQFVKFGAPFYNKMSCSDPRSPAAAPLCCTNDATDGTGMAICAYDRERVTYANAAHRCEARGRDVCQGNAAVSGWGSCHPFSQWRFSTWMGRTCSTQVQIQRDGRVSVVHDGELVDNSALQARIEPESIADVLGVDSKSIFDVLWSQELFPKAADGCSGSCTVVGDTCLCDVEAVSSAEFTDSSRIPTLSELEDFHVGALDPTAYDEGEYVRCTSELCSASEVGVWSRRMRMHEALQAEIHDVNIALNKPVTSSSNYGSSTNELVTDGTTSGLYHSQCSGEQWAQIDLQEMTPIDSVKIWHRTDCCGSRINGGQIIISDTDDFSTGVQCGGTLRHSNPSTLNVCNGMSGRYVTVRVDNACLQLLEVEVFVEAIETSDGYVYSPHIYEFTAGSDELVYNEDTIFEVPSVSGSSKFLKNQQLRVLVDGMSFRNPPTFMNFEHPTLRQAELETDAVLDHLTTHPSTAPFICKKLMQLLTSSNPSPRYVLEVVTAFRTGEYRGRVYSGEYGDLGAAFAAMFLDREARDLTLDLDPAAGKTREPLLKVLHAMRSLEFVPNRGMEFEMPHIISKFGQQAYQAPSVFNFYLPDFSPAGPVARAGLYAPEAEIMTTPFVIGYMNGMASLVDGGLSTCSGGFGTSAPSPAPHLYMPQSCSGREAKRITSNGVLTYEYQSRAGDIVSELALLLTSGREPAAVRNLWNSSQIQYANVAQNRPTSSSSEWHTGCCGADWVVDGLTTGQIFHSACSGEQWVRVDLGEAISIDHVKVWHRRDCCGERINGGTVLVSDTPDFTTGVQCAAPLVYTGDPVSTLSCPGTSGRYVTVRLEGNCLQVMELQVMAMKDGVIGEPSCAYVPPLMGYRIYAMDAGTGADGKVVSMADGNELFKNGESIATLHKGQRWTGSVDDFDEFAASGPIYGSVRATGEHVMASARLKGQLFSFGNDRRSQLGIWTRALVADASCSVRTNAGVVASQTILAGTGYIFELNTPVGGHQGVVVTCDADVVISTGHTGETDYIVVPPDATDWYGVISTTISLSQAGADALSVTEACSDGSTRSLTIPGGGTGSWSQNGYGQHYNGKACLYTAAAPFNVHSLADADGGDAVNLLPTSTGSTAFGTSTQFEWLAFASLEPGSCTCSHGTVAVDTCTNGVCKGRIGGGGPGVTCDCTTPMWGAMECAQTQDEQLFYGDLAFADGTPAVLSINPDGESECNAVTALEDETACVAAGCSYTPGLPTEPVPSEADLLPDLIKLFTFSAEYAVTNQNVLRDQARPTLPEIPTQNRPYKAIIVIFLEGGADSFNMLIPHSGCVRDLYAEYAEIRSNIALPLGSILPLDLHAESPPQPCSTYGTHPALSKVKELWDAGQASWFANIGTLIQPTTRDDFLRGDRPRGLFGHDTQQREAQSVHAQNKGASGVLGRIVDALTAQDNPYRSKVYSMYGIRKLVEGDVPPTVVGGGGVIRFSQYDQLGSTLHEITGRESDSIFADTYAAVLEESLLSTERLGAQMAAINLLGDYTGGTGMQHVARVMSLDHSVHESERDVFMIGIRTFDAHQNPAHMDINMLLGRVNSDLIALHTDLVALNLWDATTIVSISDFGRTITSNGIGTDHAWGGNNFILGGSVKGGRVHGVYPEDINPATSELEVGRGRGVFIPTTPWEGMWYGLAQWFGVAEDRILDVVPNAANFPDSALHSQDELFN